MILARHWLALAPFCLVLAGCGEAQDDDAAPDAAATAPAPDPDGADSMASSDAAPGERRAPGEAGLQDLPIMQAQVVLERLGFGPGVIDGREGLSFANALKGFQEARGLSVTGTMDDDTRAALKQWDAIPATRTVTIPEDWGRIAFTPVPDSAAAQAEMKHLGYADMAEKLAERFHTTPEVLAMLNRSGETQASGEDASSIAAPRFAAGQRIRVPNVGADRIDPATVDNKEWLATLRSLGVGTDQPEVARIVVDESEGWLKGYDAADKLVAMFTVTTGSRNDPLPIGDWEVLGVAYNPPFSFDPDLFWDVPDSEPDQELPPGPNGPVGVVWIDLDKEHYGIHGTPAPETIGRAESHGCVRLTNWDAARLAQMVGPGTKVVFQR